MHQKYLLLTRRRVLLTAAGAGFASLAPAAEATEAAMTEAIRQLIGEAPLEPGKVKLELPPIVENGNTVPLTVSVESPMTQADHVESIHIFNQKNPQPFVAAVHLGARAGKAYVAIINCFTCTYNGEEVFRAELFPAISANPFIAFSTVATQSGELVFSWTDDRSQTQTETRQITVE